MREEEQHQDLLVGFTVMVVVQVMFSLIVKKVMTKWLLRSWYVSFRFLSLKISKYDLWIFFVFRTRVHVLVSGDLHIFVPKIFFTFSFLRQKCPSVCFVSFSIFGNPLSSFVSGLE